MGGIKSCGGYIMSRENGGKLRVAVVNTVGDRPLEGMGCIL